MLSLRKIQRQKSLGEQINYLNFIFICLIVKKKKKLCDSYKKTNS